MAKQELFSVGEPTVKRSFPREYEGRPIMQGTGKSRTRIGYFRKEVDRETGEPTGRVVPWIDRFMRSPDGTETERTAAERRTLRKQVWESLESRATPVTTTSDDTE